MTEHVPVYYKHKASKSVASPPTYIQGGKYNYIDVH